MFLLGLLTATVLFHGSGVCSGCRSASRKHQVIGASATLPDAPPLPWKPLLSPGQLRRGLAFYGSGRRIERVAARLLAGQAITAVTLGGSVTIGAGSTRTNVTSYAPMFFQFLNFSFPHRDHQFLNKGIGATTSGIFAVCADKMLPPDSDLVVVELTYNEPADVPFTYPHRRGFEKMLRKLARLPRSPAVIVLHHYAWYHSHGDGKPAGLFYRAAEPQLSTLAQYYDMPSPSLRNALYPLMQADVPPYRVGRVHKRGEASLSGARLKVAGPRISKGYVYYDAIHPSDVGHQALAELLAGVVQTAVQNVLAEGKLTEGGEAAPSLKPVKLPPPMIPGTADVPTSLCAMQEDFKPLARAMRGFQYRAERPEKPTFVEQKWGYRGDAPGAWLELAFSTEEAPGRRGQATVFLGHLRSYRGMGKARVTCQSGCTCAPTVVNGLWKERVSLMQMLEVTVSQHPKCVLRITILDQSSSSSGGDSSSRRRGGGEHEDDVSSSSGSSGSDGSGSSASSGEGASKFQVVSLMVAHEPVVLTSYATQAADLAQAAG
ncbi:hypothetical protein C2E20_8274 [Micractinium conductrix]|uniref:SGNH hydrolase-type esterase domain-containing protein n=1 Tax=Micractinium conductrix TaxID=554055 RepID=A0A2P6V1X4_9CHLO|nr:hypothetical protein C2E20_8274 [Micractinium conductrix]|eukprot:PSC68096.1 hypothetical protein C2E20_8274 [Micractinium conductrix]